MKLNPGTFLSAILLMLFSGFSAHAQQSDQLIRLSEITLHKGFLKDYTQILKEESAASIQKEPGVITIFPMQVKDHPNQIRIVEIYANQAAYQAHLKTSHFLKYKTSTLKMVKSLKLIDMNAIDPASMNKVFTKMAPDNTAVHADSK